METPGEVKPETEIYYLLAKKLGFEENQISPNIPHPDKINEYLLDKISLLPNIDYEELKKAPVLSPEYKEIAFSDYIFPTPQR